MTELRERLQSALGSAYRLERELGGGGMSRVFLAEESALGRKVVVKVLPPELVAGVNVDRFRREIQLAARLQQAQIVPLLAAGEIDGLPYYSMPYVEGESLRARLANSGALPIGDVINLLRDVTRALAYAHEHGVVHRDIKPDNVLLSGGTAVVTDFGIAKALSASKEAATTDASLTQLGTSVGTPAYISPEQAAGDPNIDARSDIYSLGCMAYELLTGQPPFAGRTPQRTLVAHLTEAPAPVSALRADVPVPLADLVMRCLEKDPAARPQSAGEIATTLDAMTTGATTSGALPILTGPRGARNGLLLYVGAFALVALLAKAAVVAFGLPDWVFSIAVALMAAGLPIVLMTAYVQHASLRRARGSATPTAGAPSPSQGTLATLAIQASPHLTWRRTFRGGAFALTAFASAVAAIMVLRLFGIGPAASLMAAGKLHERERLLVIDINAGKDSSLSHVVTEAVRTNLAQSRMVSIMPPTAIAAALQRAQKPPATPVDLALARDIAQREGVKAIVAGDVTPLGTGYVVSIRLVSADSGAELAAYRQSVDGPGKLLDAIDGLTRKLRGRMGESLKEVRDAPALDQVSTGSLEALRKYAEATRAFDLAADYTKAIQLLREAVSLDTTFAMAYRKLGVALSNLGMPRAQIDSALTRAYQFRNRLPEKEKYVTIATYYMTGPGMDRQKAAEAFQQALNVDSTDVIATINLASNYSQRRLFDRAESLFVSINRSSRASQISVANYAVMLFTEGKVAAAESVFDDLKRRFPTAPAAQTYPGALLYARGQVDSSEAFWRARRTDPNALIKLSAVAQLANFALLRGRLNDTRKLATETRAINAARGVPANPLADSLLSAAISIWMLDRRDVGMRALDAALAQTPLQSLPVTQRPYFGAANYYAMAGRVDKARALLAQYDADVRDPALRRNFEPSRHSLLAEIALAEKRPLDAIREIWAADSLPDGPVSACIHCNDFDLGRAYDLANLPDSAIVHWERYIGESFTRSAARDAAYLAGVHKRLGELYEAKNDPARAATHYVAFLELWKNADPELQPKVQEVRRRLLAIQAKEKR